MKLEPSVDSEAIRVVDGIVEPDDGVDAGSTEEWEEEFPDGPKQIGVGDIGGLDTQIYIYSPKVLRNYDLV